MKILHLADLHLGKKVNDFCMLKEQKNALEQACDLIKNKNIKAILIAGDIFDKPIPSIGALELFDWFLRKLKKLSTKVFIISGNHDSTDRLSYMSQLLLESDIYISKPFLGKLEKIELNEKINVYLMPFLYPAIIKKYFPNSQIKTYNDAIKTVIDNTDLDKSKFNILLAHQFVIGDNKATTSQSEQKSVGTIDEINYKIFEKFDYTALGHLHCPQKCTLEKIRYAGSILKYSFSEINQNKSFIVLDIDNENKLNLNFYPINFLHEMKEYKGYINDFLSKEFYQNIDTDDYIHFILLDEYVIDAKKKLSIIYPNIMLLEFDNNFTRNLNKELSDINIKNKSIYEHFCDFYKSQANTELDNQKNEIIRNLLNEESKCAP